MKVGDMVRFRRPVNEYAVQPPDPQDRGYIVVKTYGPFPDDRGLGATAALLDTHTGETMTEVNQHGLEVISESG